MKTCFVSIDVEKDNFGKQDTYLGVENLDNILNIFKKYGIRATLFVAGEVLERYHNLATKWAQEHEIGCHNYQHIDLDKIDLAERERQIKRFIRVYQAIFQKTPQGFRAPRNIIDNKQFEILERYGFAYDSSVIPRHLFLHKYEGYKGRAPIGPYFPSNKNYRKKDGMKILEIPNSPLLGGIPFAATWIRRLGVGFFKILLSVKKPDFLSLSMHSWDGIKFKGKSSKNSGEKFLRQLDEILKFLKEIGYEFKNGSQLIKNFQRIKDRGELQGLLDRALFKTFFHSLEWQDFLEKEFKWLKFEHYLYKDELLLTFGRIGKKLISLPFCEYGGPLPLKNRIDFDKFNKDVLEEFGDNIKIKFHPEVEIGNYDSDISTHWIEDLKNISEQKLLNSFRKTLRHEIRHAEECSLEIKKCEKLKELKRFYNLYVANLKKKKTVPYPFPVIKYLSERPESEILLALYSAKGGSASGGKIIAGSLFLEYNGFVHYFLSASDYKYRNFGANYLILWEKIKNLCGQDKIFDLGASPKSSAL